MYISIPLYVDQKTTAVQWILSRSLVCYLACRFGRAKCWMSCTVPGKAGPALTIPCIGLGIWLQNTFYKLRTYMIFLFFCQFFITLSCDTFHLQSIEHWKILLKMITKRKMLHVSFFSSAIEWVVNELYSAITYCTFESNPLIMINQFAVTTKVVRAQEFALSTIVAVFIDITVFIADGWLGL